MAEQKVQSFLQWNRLPMSLRNSISCFLPIESRMELGHCSKSEHKNLSQETASWCKTIYVDPKFSSTTRNALSLYPAKRCQSLYILEKLQDFDVNRLAMKHLYGSLQNFVCADPLIMVATYSVLLCLKTLTFTGITFSGQIGNSVASLIMPYNLETLRFSSCHFDDIKRGTFQYMWCPNIKILTFDNCCSVDAVLILNELGESIACKKLESIRFVSGGQWQVTKPTFTKESLKERFPRLSSITITERVDLHGRDVSRCMNASITIILLWELKQSGILGEIKVEMNGFGGVKRDM